MADIDDRDPSDSHEESPAGAAETDPLNEIATRLSELLAFVAHLASVKVDQVRFGFRRFLVAAAAFFLIGVFLATIVAVSAVYIARGTAEGLAAIFDDMPGAAVLLTGVLLLGSVLIGGAIVAGIFNHRFKQYLVDKYETRRDRQQAEFGITIDDAAVEPTPDGDGNASAGVSTGDLRDPRIH